MRVVIVTECFTPAWNGVTNSVLRVVEHLHARGHTALVVAPGPGPSRCGPGDAVPVVRVPSGALPAYRSLSVGLPTGHIRRTIEDFEPDVVHLAAPVLLGEAAGRAAQALAVPAVAVYQTDLVGFARRYRLGAASGLTWSWLRRVHNQADLTLAPSSLAEWDLRRHGIGPVARWGRGVDLERWSPRIRSSALRRQLLGPGNEVLVGYSGRLAAEKRVGLLAHLRGLPRVKVVVVGDGPARSRLERQLPGVTFLGYRSGAELSRVVASLDVFVHTGPHETFCQAVQEALAAGVPVVAPASGGPLDLVAHGGNGWLYPADNPSVLREAVGALAADPALRAQMATAARASVAGRSWASVGEQLVAHYRHVTGSSLTARRAA
ncbi:glycosyltransferase family 1 protein [Acidiferrimicrobium sp. IK]|uniref:glycosyltransferase family 4 protein n=1 Tax=Acidiferrimicrobium sp. IK TaxID=2871700 RepID=UPI0021CB0CF2|nr:glycosyltransferase family 1 protein [Acidiferrimicrobium sp. IK]MCU4185412.1 glycosyltransferase family 1 protein [Acidiferrimicrobium sp. IK]